MMREKSAALLALALLTGCAGSMAQRTGSGTAEIKVIAFNDFHGNIEPSGLTIDETGPDGSVTRIPAGGVAQLAATVAELKAANPNNVVVSAGDLIGASPLVSNLFLDEPAIAAMNILGLEFNAVGNHEFDRGQPELMRMQKGGCEKNTAREPCRVDRAFAGARFPFLAANTVRDDGETLFAPTGIKEFDTPAGRVRIAFIGMTLKDTPSVALPEGVKGLTFRDEAATANALVPKLKAEGADAIVVVIHQGAQTTGGYNDKNCPGLDGDIVPILAQLDPRVDLVVSGHTHQAYICDYGKVDQARPFLLTSAGRYGTLVTDIRLTIDPSANKVLAKSADNRIVRTQGPASPEVAALVARYTAQVAPLTARVVGRMSGPATRDKAASGDMTLGNLIADAQLAATRAPDAGGASIALMNPGGVRADLTPEPDGAVTFGQLFAVQPFGNTLMVVSFTGRQLRGVLEQQFDSGPNTVASPKVLLVSAGFSYAYDLSRPPGQRILDMRLDGAPIADDAVYRVAISNFLASGGDNFSLLAQGRDPTGGPQDIDALEDYIAAAGTLAPPAADRIVNRTPS